MSVCVVRCTNSAAMVGTTVCVCSNSWSNSSGCYLCVEWYVEPCVAQCRCVALSRDAVRLHHRMGIKSEVVASPSHFCAIAFLSLTALLAQFLPAIALFSSEMTWGGYYCTFGPHTVTCMRIKQGVVLTEEDAMWQLVRERT